MILSRFLEKCSEMDGTLNPQWQAPERRGSLMSTELGGEGISEFSRLVKVLDIILSLANLLVPPYLGLLPAT